MQMKNISFTAFLIAIFSLSMTYASGKAQSKPWVKAYYAGWMQGQNNDGYLTAQNIDYTAITEIAHFALVPNSDGTLDAASNSITSTNSSSLVSDAHAAGVKVLITVGGWNSETGFLGATGATNLSTFVSNLVSFMTSRGYDGIDIDWEPLVSTDAAQYTSLIIALRSALNKISPKPLLTCAVGSEASLLASLVNDFDQVDLMTYDFSGAWPGWVTWHNSPVYDGGIKFPSTGALVPSINGTVQTFTSAGILTNKLGIGIDFYGYVWTGGAGTPTGGVTAPDQSWTTAPTVTSNVPYYTIKQQYYSPNYYRWDSGAQASYLSINTGTASTDQFISYDDQNSIKAKVQYVKSNGLGGIIIWELGGGYVASYPAGERDSLLQAVKHAVNGSGTIDTTPPTVSITSPSNGSTDSGTVTISANATDNVGVTGVTFKLDGSQLGNIITSSPFTYLWNTTTVSNGTHTISATAFDAAGNTATASINVTVSNTSPPTGGSGNGSSTDLWVYQNGLNSSWTNASWSATVNFSSTGELYTGTAHSAQVVQNAWGALRLLSGTWGTPININSTSYTNLQFEIYTTAPLNINVYLENSSSQAYPTVNYGTIPANQWVLVSMPISSLDPNGAAFEQLIIQDVSGKQVTYYIDNLKFSGQQTAVAAPILVSPANSSNGIPTSTLLTWTMPVGSTSYIVQVAADQNFDTLVINTSGITTASDSIKGLAINKTYYWKVGTSVSGTTVWSQVWSFTTTGSSSQTPPYYIYNNAIVSPWIDASWSATVNYSNNSPVYSGASSSIKVVQNAWGGLSLHYGSWGSGNSTSTSGYNGLQFEIFSPTTISMNVQFENDGGNSFPQVNYGTVPANSWTVVTIPFSKLNPNNYSVQRIDILEVSGVQVTYYIGALSFVNSNILASTTTDINTVQESSRSFSLEQNYPNPFNPSTSITYSLPTESHVILKIYNTLGQEVATLIDDNMDAGTHNVIWNGSNLASGIYFYRLQFGNQTLMKKMLMLK